MSLVPYSRPPGSTSARRIRRPWFGLRGSGAVIASNVIDMRQGSSLIASAQRIVSTKIGAIKNKAEAWMVEAWIMFDVVGELHFLATTLGRRASGARFYVGKVDGNAVIELEKPAPGVVIPPAQRASADLKAMAIMSSLGDGFMGIQEIVTRAFVNQFVVGAAYLVGAPAEVWNPKPGIAFRPIDTVPLNELVWKSLSLAELAQTEAGYELRQKGIQSQFTTSLKWPVNSVYVISLWNSHPNDMSVPDSPVRATLPVLRELVGLTQHVSAQIDSRLAGAGILFMKSSASRAIKQSLGIPEDDKRDPFTEMLIDAMVTPISERDSASAVVPLVVTIPDESDVPEYKTFSSELDQYASDLRSESIRRIALSLDAPPELLLGQGDANHWSAWLTAQEVVDAHIAPTLAIIAAGLTTEFLRPILRVNGVPAAVAETYAIWFDTSDLVVQANQGADAQALYELDLLSDEATRRANGFDESDAPKKADVKDQAIDLVKEMVVQNPGLINRPGLDVLTEQMVAFLNGEPLPGLSGASAIPASSIGGGSSAKPALTAGKPPAANPSGPPNTRVPAAAELIQAFGAQRQRELREAALVASGEGFGSWK